VNRADRIGLAIGLAIGVPMMAWGVWAFFVHSAGNPRANVLRFFIGGDVIHDVVVAPVAALVGIVLVARVPEVARAQLRAALFTTAIVVAVAWPGIRAYGHMRVPDNGSVQPLNYATAVPTVVAFVWVVCGLWFIVDLRRSRR
jgi:hypothetical protein